ncbi:GntR family transcriptional regulator [Agathobaculum sp. Marseille-P7918]|uniref:GntR family transcriptional regulator n=1 Tax=Agathobaculum sp. Marseille-P7918 TaxID=2479843 RepID=UPI00356667B7
MIPFDNFHMEEGIPIYQQILLYLKRGIVAGDFHDGDELPSRRMLSALLGVNPNTVQKAYRQLEEENLICSHTGSKSYMVLDTEKIAQIRAELLQSDVKSVVQSMKQMGLSKAEALRLIQAYWD